MKERSLGQSNEAQENDMEKIEIGRKVKAWCQKDRAYVIGRVERIDERDNPVVRPESYEGKRNPMMDYVVSARILTVVALRDCAVIG